MIIFSCSRKSSCYDKNGKDTTSRQEDSRALVTSFLEKLLLTSRWIVTVASCLDSHSRCWISTEESLNLFGVNERIETWASVWPSFFILTLEYLTHTASTYGRSKPRSRILASAIRAADAVEDDDVGELDENRCAIFWMKCVSLTSLFILHPKHVRSCTKTRWLCSRTMVIQSHYSLSP